MIEFTEIHPNILNKISKFNNMQLKENNPVVSEFKYKLGNEGWHNLLTNSLNYGNNYIVTEKINVKREFRVLYFYQEEPIVIERYVDPTGEQWQANSCINEGKNVSEVDFTEIDPELLTKIAAMASYLKAPFLSIDVYLDHDNNWGVFEFQSEFGFTYVPHSKLNRRLKDSVKNMYNKLNKKSNKKIFN